MTDRETPLVAASVAAIGMKNGPIMAPDTKKLRNAHMNARIGGTHQPGTDKRILPSVLTTPMGLARPNSKDIPTTKMMDPRELSCNDFLEVAALERAKNKGTAVQSRLRHLSTWWSYFCNQGLEQVSDRLV